MQAQPARMQARRAKDDNGQLVYFSPDVGSPLTSANKVIPVLRPYAALKP